MISIVYCGNSGIFDGLIISMLSVAAHASRPLDVHILTMDLTHISPKFTPISEEQAEFLRAMIINKKPGSRLSLHDLSSEFVSEMSGSPNMYTSYTPYTLLRLFCDVAPLPDRVLYMDTDTAAAGDIAELFDWDLDGCFYGAVSDFLGRVFIGPKYINAGVLLLDLAQIRQNGFLEKTRRFCAKKKTAFPDQDAINRLSSSKCFLPRKFNEQYEMKDDTVIRHFSRSIRWFPIFHIVNIKPWNIEELHRVYRTFEFDDVLEEYLELKGRFEAGKPDGILREKEAVL